MSREQYVAAVGAVKEHILAGDAFQVVLSHRFKRRTFADPFEVYRRATCLIFDEQCQASKPGHN